MHKLYALSALLLGATALPLQAQFRAPAGGGGQEPPRTACMTPSQHARYDSIVTASIQRLEREKKLPTPAQRPAAVALAWPVRQAAGFDYASYYGVSNYVDRNASYPNQTLDWNCGTRTYDTSAGYNHGGIDIYLWPFNFNMMDAGQVDVVAAAPGIIVSKADGNFDRNCAMSNANWNAVYVQQADGSVAWYGHLKTGSQTAKPVGASVAQGEFLGKVGSSGSSTGPHLHFEVHNAAGQVVDPYTGNCNTGPTWWSEQKPYYESTLNTVMTHSAPPVFANCPGTHTTNQKTAFAANDLVYFAAYYHDQMAGQVGSYTVYAPDNSVFATWTHSMTPAYYSSSYWYWSIRLPTNAATGTWRFAVTYQGNTVTRAFTVGAVTASTQPAEQASFALYPNPAQQQLTVEATGTRQPGILLIRNSLGQVVATYQLAGRRTTLPLTLAAGVYMVSVSGDENAKAQQLVVY
ncbi:peptidoglycan DD-metalloendopeptidase family protein [Hymenobacter lucidus]|uniref:Peptidoglycan DD-metalloendopeptidase family protein n=1 Tax=Hymenobacter lucidus TaxID=2880930 RepID=A0ABS8AXG5_9BACT|nr:peptidoglycan DD-metalloendopeptidase family protein [Hymenobacter lucidus]MCB2410495.1 peptidoglycan DD-metalloendopeptidase family protein [Hymenobacter lucidus]